MWKRRRLPSQGTVLYFPCLLVFVQSYSSTTWLACFCSLYQLVSVARSTHSSPCSLGISRIITTTTTAATTNHQLETFFSKERCLFLSLLVCSRVVIEVSCVTNFSLSLHSHFVLWATVVASNSLFSTQKELYIERHDTTQVRNEGKKVRYFSFMFVCFAAITISAYQCVSAVIYQAVSLEFLAKKIWFIFSTHSLRLPYVPASILKNISRQKKTSWFDLTLF